MKKCRLILLIILFPLFPSPALGFDFMFGGYAKNMQMASFVNHSDHWILANMWNTRINMRSFITDELTWTFGGNFFFLYSNNIVSFAREQSGWYYNRGPRDFSFGYVANSYAGGGFFDRNYIEYQRENWSLSAGVQRINWGMNLIWNPNDIFNAYSVYDFDYEERPGILSVRGRYYTSVTSNVDVVATTADIFAALYRFSVRERDFQVIAALDSNSIIAATGFAADVLNAGLRGEATMFYDRDVRDKNYIGALTADYTFANGFYIHAGALYNSFGVEENALLHKITSNHENPVKNLSAGKYSTLMQIAYPFTPLLSGSAMAVVNMSDYSVFASPMITYSMFENMEVLLASQFNFGDENDEFSESLGRSFFVRFRGSF